MSYSIFGTLYGSNNNPIQGVRRPKGDGFKITNGNYDIENKRLTNISSPVENKDCVAKEFLDQIPGVSLTRSIRAAGGLFMEGERVDGLADIPQSLSSATSKKYVNDEDNKVKAYVNSKDQAMKTYVDNGDMYKYISTFNEFTFEPADFSNPDGNIATFLYGEVRDYSLKYHRAKSHVICTLIAPQVF